MILSNLSVHGWGCVPRRVVDKSSTEPSRQMDGARSWCQDGELWESSH